MQSRLDATVISETEEALVYELRQCLRDSRATPTHPDGLHKIALRDRLYRILLRILQDLVDGKVVSLRLSAQELTTQEAANLLGVSRQFLVRVLDEGKISFHRVGTHRRVYLQDVIAFRKERDRRRHAAIEEIARDALKDSVYDDF